MHARPGASDALDINASESEELAPLPELERTPCTRLSRAAPKVRSPRDLSFQTSSSTPRSPTASTVPQQHHTLHLQTRPCSQFPPCKYPQAQRFPNHTTQTSGSRHSARSGIFPSPPQQTTRSASSRASLPATAVFAPMPDAVAPGDDSVVVSGLGVRCRCGRRCSMVGRHRPAIIVLTPCHRLRETSILKVH